MLKKAELEGTNDARTGMPHGIPWGAVCGKPGCYYWKAKGNNSTFRFMPVKHYGGKLLCLNCYQYLKTSGWPALANPLPVLGPLVQQFIQQQLANIAAWDGVRCAKTGGTKREEPALVRYPHAAPEFQDLSEGTYKTAARNLKLARRRARHALDQKRLKGHRV
ncbi:hypothetical protein IQ07DRAFT_648791 [Pyrenochaeta sp. DS3sAY3a]|nr:hypothetical protein IQ07DRAFT_648791 [Pyrenochaeta sp. DS3sAY3a]